MLVVALLLRAVSARSAVLVLVVPLLLGEV
jgi:hypothetical protein